MALSCSRAGDFAFCSDTTEFVEALYAVDDGGHVLSTMVNEGDFGSLSLLCPFGPGDVCPAMRELLALCDMRVDATSFGVLSGI